MEVRRGRERVGGDEIEWEWSNVLLIQITKLCNLSYKKEERYFNFYLSGNICL